jgi:hypothetical protein
MPNAFSFMNSGGVRHPFDQGPYLGGGKVKVSLTDPTSEESVGDGICRELVRMWIMARLHSANPPGANLRAVLDTDTDELKLLHHHIRTIIVRQAMTQANTTDTTGDALVTVQGLSVKKRNAVTSKTALAKQVMRKPGRFYLCQVAFTTGGWHAVGFDTRGDRFHFFDPNTGHWIHARSVMEKHLRDFLENYNEKFDYCFGVSKKCYVIEYGKSPGW